MSDCSYSGNFHYVPLAQTGFFSPLVVDYIGGSEKLKPFYAFEPSFQGLDAAIAQRKQFPVNRKVLVDVLQKQYASLDISDKLQQQINALLSEDTFTITTAHQPNLATGYAYFIYKIMHTVVLSEQLNKAHPIKHFVPVYYIGSEDDDIEEIGVFKFNEHTFRWTTEQTGAVGAMNPKELKPLLESFFRVLGPPNEHTLHLKDLLSQAYLQHDTIADATRYIVHQLFHTYGLLVIDPNDRDLKRCFASVMQEELLQPVAQKLVHDQNELLNQHYTTQAYARPINLFYLKDGIRKRIEQKDATTWIVVDTAIAWTQKELLAELEAYPERFSPNVILRGLYQESILPNIAFIGGGAEVAYWFQLKQVFDHYKVFFPTVILRQSAQFITIAQQEKMQQLDWDETTIFKQTKDVLKAEIFANSGEQLDTTEEWQQINNALMQLKEKISLIDANLAYSTEAVLHKMSYQMDVLNKKMFKAERRKYAVQENRMNSLKQALFPKGSLQERYYTFMQEYAYLGPKYLQYVHDGILPFGDAFLIVK